MSDSDELTGAPLDLAVAKREGHETAYMQRGHCYLTPGYPYSPSTNPVQGWPIVEREKIVTYYDYGTKKWYAEMTSYDGKILHLVCRASGDTLLKAACRAYVEEGRE